MVLPVGQDERMAADIEGGPDELSTTAAAGHHFCETSCCRMRIRPFNVSLRSINARNFRRQAILGGQAERQILFFARRNACHAQRGQGLGFLLVPCDQGYDGGTSINAFVA